MDVFDHVNNINYLRWFEVVRIEQLLRLGIRPEPSDMSLILGEVNCRYLRPLTFPDTVEISTRTSALGTTSWTVDYKLVSKAQNAVAATGWGRLVFFDYKKNSKIAIPQELRDRISKLEGRSFDKRRDLENSAFACFVSGRCMFKLRPILLDLAKMGMGMGWTNSKLEKQLAEEPGHFFGLENFGNTCYCNSVLQALHSCRIFRAHVANYYEGVIERRGEGRDAKEHLLSCLAEMFYQIGQQKRKTGTFAPKKFISQLRHENVVFRGYSQQDAHELLNFLLNRVVEILQSEQQGKHSEESGDGATNGTSARTFVHEVFEGVMTNETKCLNCETITSKDESFFDLSIDIEENTSITHCLRNFSSIEMLDREDKFYCEVCNSLQEAQKSLKIKTLPNILIVHLKRFKYMEAEQQYRKLSHRVVFPFELKLWNTSQKAVDAERYYDLFAIVIHIGSGPYSGHYITYIKHQSVWICFDDENVEMIDEDKIQSVYGHTGSGRNANGYLLFYQTREEKDSSVLTLSDSDSDTAV